MTAPIDISPETIERMAANYEAGGLPALAATLRAQHSALTASGDDVAGLLAAVRALLAVTDHGSNSGPVFEARVIAYRGLNGRGAIAKGETKNARRYTPCAGTFCACGTCTS